MWLYYARLYSYTDANTISCTVCRTQVMSHGCDLHEAHSSSERGILRGDFVNKMFCATAVLRSGPVWMDLKSAMNRGCNGMAMVWYCSSFNCLEVWSKNSLTNSDSSVQQHVILSLC